MTPGQGLGLFSEAGDPRLGLTLPIGDSGARLGVIASSDDMVRICRCAEMGPSLGKPVSAFQYSDAQYTDAPRSICAHCADVTGMYVS